MNDRTVVRFERVDAESRHGHLVMYDEDNGQTFGECEVGGERCFTFGPYNDKGALEQAFVEHAATAVGVCWSCSDAIDGWPNRERCYRCWLMFYAEQGVWLRDCPPWPGAHSYESATS